MNCKIIVIGIFTFLLFFVGFSSASFLEDEAGISARIKVDNVNLSQAETAFKYIEAQTDTYIIGSVAIDGYGESYDVHVYVDVSGDMVAYYLKSEPASKIIDWVNYSGGLMTLEGCKLEDALTKVCNAMLKSLPEVAYYDFRYPSAQKIEIIIDEEKVKDLINEEKFKINISGNHTVINCTWSHAVFKNTTISNPSPDLGFNLDGVELHFISDNLLNYSWTIWEGVVSLTALLPDIYHEFVITGADDEKWASYSGIVLIYSEGQ